MFTVPNACTAGLITTEGAIDLCKDYIAIYDLTQVSALPFIYVRVTFKLPCVCLVILACNVDV